VQKLHAMAVAHTAQGKNMDRVQRIYLVDDAATPPAPPPEDNLRLYRVEGAAIARELPAKGSPRDHIYLIDPLGNLVLRYPANPDARRMIKDLTRLLQASRIG
jgi:hypothetical protein